MLRDNDNSNNSKDDLKDSSQECSEDSSGDYSESSIIGSDKEFGLERSQLISNEDGPDVDKSLPWVPTFKEIVGKRISRLLNDSMKFCTSGKITPPITSISLLKVCHEI